MAKLLQMHRLNNGDDNNIISIWDLSFLEEGVDYLSRLFGWSNGGPEKMVPLHGTSDKNDGSLH